MPPASDSYSPPFAATDAPIGVFDSGIGGLSVLRALMAALPCERFVYLADSAHAPYGEKGDAVVLERSRAVLDQLRSQHGVKALVIACNTATAAAVQQLRAQWLELPIVGIEPALKPAAAMTRTGHVGVLATQGTLASEKFRGLLARLAGSSAFHPVACDGLANAIENEASSLGGTGAGEGSNVDRLIDRYLRDMGEIGTRPGAIDTLVLGCTHYPLVLPQWQARLPDGVSVIDPAPAVANRTRDVLGERGLLSARRGIAPPMLIATGSTTSLRSAAARWLNPTTAGRGSH